MSGTYEKTSYLTDDYQSRYVIKIQPETRSLTINGYVNNSGGESLDGLPYITSSGSRRQSRPLARVVRVRFTAPMPSGYSPNSGISLPWLRPEGYAGFTASSTGTYQGSPIQFVSKQDEKLI